MCFKIFTLKLSSELKNINTKVVVDPTLPTTKDHECPSCGQFDAVFFEAQTKSGDHDLRLYFVCRLCKRRWTENAQGENE
jgi:DNA-directed RNA polymerase subunit M/transcription elongation factor TFIIS